MKKVILYILIFIPLFAHSQDDWDWGTDKPETEKHWAALRTMTASKSYKAAVPYLYWLLDNAPKLNQQLYIKGAEIYSGLAKTEKDAATLISYQDSVLWMHDREIEFFGNKAEVLNRKGLVLFNYLSKRQNQTKVLYNAYAEIIALNQTEAFPSHLTYFMVMSCQMKKYKFHGDSTLRKDYHSIKTLLQKKINLAKGNAKLLSTLEKNEKIIRQQYFAAVDITCEDINNELSNDFIDNPNLTTAKELYYMMVTKKCTDNPLFITVSDTILRREPNADGYILLAKQKITTNDISGGESNYLKAAEFTTDLELKSDIYINLANLFSKNNQTKAKTYAEKAIATGKNTATAYTIIGNLYYNSYQDCNSENDLKARLIFIAAYEQYKNAGDTEKMALAKKQFPTMELIHTYNKTVGETLNTECWMNESVVLQIQN